jgi:hypothetical protein
VMADELTINIQAIMRLNGIQELVSPGQLLVDASAFGISPTVQNIGTSSETVDQTGVGTAGYAFFQNQDTTNFIKIGPDSTGIVDFIKLLPGEYCLLPLKPSVVIKAIADTAACDLLYKIFER